MMSNHFNKTSLLILVLTLGSMGAVSAQMLNYENDYVFRAQVGDRIETAWLNPVNLDTKRIGFAFPVAIQAVTNNKQQSLIPSQKASENRVIPAFHAIFIKKIKKADQQQMCLFDQKKPLLCFDIKPQEPPLEKMKVVFERID